jgi:hypothetical protein
MILKTAFARPVLTVVIQWRLMMICLNIAWTHDGVLKSPIYGVVADCQALNNQKRFISPLTNRNALYMGLFP